MFIFLCIFYDIGISFADSAIGAFVVNAENFDFRNFTEFYNIFLFVYRNSLNSPRIAESRKIINYFYFNSNFFCVFSI